MLFKIKIHTFLLVSCLVLGLSCHKYVDPFQAIYSKELCREILSQVDHQHYTWIENKLPPTKASIIVLHGLNNHPAIFEQLEEHLKTQGHNILRVAFTGHSLAPETDKNWRKAWQMEWLGAKCMIDEKFGIESKSILLAFSLGALISVDNFSNIKNLSPSDMIAFAPAWTPHTHVGLLKLAGMKDLDWLVPSFGNPQYRANDGLQNRAYQALFSMLKTFSPDELKRFSTLVFLDPQDELISIGQLKKLKNKLKLNLNLIEIDNSENKLDPTYHHLIVDEKSASKSQWPKIIKAIDDFLQN